VHPVQHRACGCPARLLWVHPELDLAVAPAKTKSDNSSARAWPETEVRREQVAQPLTSQLDVRQIKLIRRQGEQRGDVLAIKTIERVHVWRIPRYVG